MISVCISFGARKPHKNTSYASVNASLNGPAHVPRPRPPLPPPIATRWRFVHGASHFHRSRYSRDGIPPKHACEYVLGREDSPRPRAAAIVQKIRMRVHGTTPEKCMNH